MASGIYCIENLINGKRYIGQSVVIEKRVRGYHQRSAPLNFAIEKYGEENFRRYSILYCDTEELDYYEIKCIEIFHSHVSEWGYNILIGGGGTRGRIVSKKTRKKLSIASSGEKNPNYGNVGSKNSLYGKPRPNNVKIKISLSSIGKKFKKATSKYFGVYKEKSSGRWRAFFKLNKKAISIGRYKKEVEAAKAFDDYVIKNNINRPLNF